MKIKLLVIGVLAVLVGGAVWLKSAPEQGTSVVYSVLDEGIYFGYLSSVKTTSLNTPEAKLVWIKSADKDSFDNTWIARGKTLSSGASPLPPHIDFDREMIVTVVRRIGSHEGLRILTITEAEDALIIHIELTDSRGSSLSVVTQPYIMLRMPRSVKQISFDVSRHQD